MNKCVTSALKEIYGFSSTTIRYEDFQLAENQCRQIQKSNPENSFLQGNDMPGFHDIRLGTETIKDLCYLDSPSKSASVPNFESGFGNRVPGDKPRKVQGPIDLVILQGGCSGTALPPKKS